MFLVVKAFEIKAEYERIMAEELKLANAANFPGTLMGCADEIYETTLRILEVAKSSALPRSYTERYLMSGGKPVRVAYESVGAHANLAAAMLDMALSYWYGPDFGTPASEFPETIDGYSHREIMEVMRLHDLPENETGDIPDDGDRDEAEKLAKENDYYRRYIDQYPSRESYFGQRVRKLLLEMETQSSAIGRLVYVADKASAIVMTLVFDLLKCSPVMHIDNEDATERDKFEMETCDDHFGGYRRASEMWTIGYLKVRQTQQYDEVGFFTAVIVMATLIVRGYWYDWREKDYNLSTPC
ncbi:MAG: HD domain-containing protein [Candidatus Saccharibacteria bacterium]|nr:HD domain-containing protein [Candidatus Saccharibacteria bacterium]